MGRGKDPIGADQNQVAEAPYNTPSIKTDSTECIELVLQPCPSLPLELAYENSHTLTPAQRSSMHMCNTVQCVCDPLRDLESVHTVNLSTDTHTQGQYPVLAKQ